MSTLGRWLDRLRYRTYHWVPKSAVDVRKREMVAEMVAVGCQVLEIPPPAIQWFVPPYQRAQFPSRPLIRWRRYPLKALRWHRWQRYTLRGFADDCGYSIGLNATELSLRELVKTVPHELAHLAWPDAEEAEVEWFGEVVGAVYNDARRRTSRRQRGSAASNLTVTK
jgi:hypothetical protein